MRRTELVLLTTLLAGCASHPASVHDAKPTPSIAPTPTTPLTAEPLTARALRGDKLSAAEIDALWDALLRLKDPDPTVPRAVVAVADPSYGPKAAEALKPKLRTALEPSAELLRQEAAIRVLGDLRYAGAVKPLMAVLTSQNKVALAPRVEQALLRVASDAEPALIDALSSSSVDEFGKVRVASALATLAREAGHKAVHDAWAHATSDALRVGFALGLLHFPLDFASHREILLATYKSTKSTQAKRDLAAAAADGTFDAALVPWLLKEAETIDSEDLAESTMAPLTSALMLATSAQKQLLKDTLARVKAKLRHRAVSDEWVDKLAAPALERLDACGDQLECYLASAEQKKAATMCVVLGGGANADATRAELVRRFVKTTDARQRAIVSLAIDALAPSGDTVASTAMEQSESSPAGQGVPTWSYPSDVAIRLRLRWMP